LAQNEMADISSVIGGVHVNIFIIPWACIQQAAQSATFPGGKEM
jgi:hypothetical protein